MSMSEELESVGRKLEAPETRQQPVYQFCCRKCEYVGYVSTVCVCMCVNE